MTREQLEIAKPIDNQIKDFEYIKKSISTYPSGCFRIDISNNGTKNVMLDSKKFGEDEMNTIIRLIIRQIDSKIEKLIERLGEV